TDYTLQISPAVAIALAGAVFSSNTGSPKTRTRSGKQTLWGSFIDIGIDPILERNFERFVGESQILLPEDFIETIHIPPSPGFRFSSRRQLGSTLSAGKVNDY